MQRWVACAPRAFAVALFLVGISQANAETVGAMRDVVHTVYGTPPQGQQTAKRIGDAVLHNEVFETWKESRALLEFIDGSRLALGANSKVVIDDFVFDPAQVKGNALINLTAGTLRFVTGQMPHGGVVIKTPTATLTLRGTDVSVHVHPDGTTDATVQAGLVEAHNDLNGDTTNLLPGEGTTLGQGGNQPFEGDGGPEIQKAGGLGGNLHVEQRRENNTPIRDFTPANPPASHGDEGGGGSTGGNSGGGSTNGGDGSSGGDGASGGDGSSGGDSSGGDGGDGGCGGVCN